MSRWLIVERQVGSGVPIRPAAMAATEAAPTRDSPIDTPTMARPAVFEDAFNRALSTLEVQRARGEDVLSSGGWSRTLFQQRPKAAEEGRPGDHLGTPRPSCGGQAVPVDMAPEADGSCSG